MIVTSVIILVTTFKSSQHLVHLATNNQLPRKYSVPDPVIDPVPDPVPDPLPKTIKVDLYYREYGGVYLGPSSQNLQQLEDILDAEEPSLNNIVALDEEIVELHASTLEDSEGNNFHMLPHPAKNTVRNCILIFSF